MKIVSTNVFVGPSVYAHFPVIRHVLDLGELEQWPTSRLGEAFVEPQQEVVGLQWKVNPLAQESDAPVPGSLE